MLSPLNTAVMTLAAKYHADGRRPYSDLIAADLGLQPGVVFDAIAELADTACLTKFGAPTQWGLYQAGLPVCLTVYSPRPSVESTPPVVMDAQCDLTGSVTRPTEPVGRRRAPTAYPRPTRAELEDLLSDLCARTPYTDNPSFLIGTAERRLRRRNNHAQSQSP